jgi:hypothetical protein
MAELLDCTQTKRVSWRASEELDSPITSDQEEGKRGNWQIQQK